ncbi:SRPBCC domain-containing protein [Dyadobacter jiangsuensis]|uniref:Uncharacterized protein YndB with AHSA1/START domain n=1 Tax=Dyadobacter jiangsuensis TaxID=1591085 RepID=A0A2P8FR47_9BACT|nr:SRPBCC domain-containing protein [Dyadobacter jiangsuensis]PSL24201.1 uncharacterized protein YndB with AHSA1/START domain [Dyadobacter jiangsuensis]
MNRKQLATTTISIHASPSAVWKALVEPELVKKYFHGTEMRSDFEIGSPITFEGEWQGQHYVDKGEILRITPERELSYSFWSPLSGTEDFEDNYTHVTFHLSDYHENTTLVVTQDNLEDDDAVVKAEGNWLHVLHELKKVVEEERLHVL